MKDQDNTASCICPFKPANTTHEKKRELAFLADLDAAKKEKEMPKFFSVFGDNYWI